MGSNLIALFIIDNEKITKNISPVECIFKSTNQHKRCYNAKIINLEVTVLFGNLTFGSHEEYLKLFFFVKISEPLIMIKKPKMTIMSNFNC